MKNRRGRTLCGFLVLGLVGILGAPPPARAVVLTTPPIELSTDSSGLFECTVANVSSAAVTVKITAYDPGGAATDLGTELLAPGTGTFKQTASGAAGPYTCAFDVSGSAARVRAAGAFFIFGQGSSAAAVAQ